CNLADKVCDVDALDVGKVPPGECVVEPTQMAINFIDRAQAFADGVLLAPLRGDCCKTFRWAFAFSDSMNYFPCTFACLLDRVGLRISNGVPLPSAVGHDNEALRTARLNANIKAGQLWIGVHVARAPRR